MEKMEMIAEKFEIKEAINRNYKVDIMRAREKGSSTSVIIKILDKKNTTLGEIAGFAREYFLLKKLSSAIKGVATPLSFNEYPLYDIMVLKDIGGYSLDKIFESERPSVKLFLSVALRITEILEVIHNNGIVHKDIKPSNIVMNPETGEIEIIDFEISGENVNEKEEFVNIMGTVEGTMGYISPEQTGRMNRSIDYRSDYYSLGVTLYELLSGKKPFETEDPVEMTYCHLAQKPADLQVIAENIPEVISDIVMKLLEKEPGNRYQSAAGLKSDLNKCIEMLNSTGTVENFRVGMEDLPENFHISPKLYGRDEEINKLIDGYKRASEGRTELMVVEGYSGIGKSSLVHEIYKTILVNKGYFISGKFEQLKRNIPYYAIIEALKEIIKTISGSNQEEKIEWADKIKKAVGFNGRLITEIIPELVDIIGEQPEVEHLDLNESKNRFRILFKNFIKIFISHEHPLVLFLDDLHWSDFQSLKLIKDIALDSEISNLYIVITFRNNEVYPGHPLVLMLNDIKSENTAIETIFLEPLTLENTKQLIADSLSTTMEKASDISEYCYNKSLGNPFFINQLMKLFYEKGYIAFDRKKGGWHWDMPEIRRAGVSNDISELIRNKILQMKDETIKILQYAACIGSIFDVSSLSLLTEINRKEIVRKLWESIREGYIIPVDENYKYIEYSDSLEIKYKFFHDRIQHAAYSTIPEEKRAQVHYETGHVFEIAGKQNMFFLVNHYNLALDYIKTYVPSRKMEIAAYNLEAAKKAMHSAAYDSVLKYAEAAVSLMERSAWNDNYDFMVELFSVMTAASYLTAKFDEMENCAKLIFENAKTLSDKLAVYETLIQSNVARNKPVEAINIAMKALSLLGIKFPKKPSLLNVFENVALIFWLTAGKTTDDLKRLPPASDKDDIAVMRILTSIGAAAFIVDTNLYLLLMLKLVELSIKKGNTPYSAYGYVNYGLILTNAFYMINSGYDYGKLSLEILERFNAENLRAKVNMVYNTTIRYYREAVSETFPQLLEGYNSGLVSGDYEYGAYNATVYGYNSFFAGKKLSGFYKEMREYSMEFQKLKQTTQYNYNQLFCQAASNIMNTEEDGHIFSGSDYNEKRMLPLHVEAKDRHIICNLYILKTMIAYIFEDFDAALRYTKVASKDVKAVLGFMTYPQYYFYDSLARLASYEKADKTERLKITAKVAANQMKMKIWAKNAPENFENKYFLIKAEIYRVKGKYLKAEAFYEMAITKAKTNGLLHEAAIASEAAYRFYKMQEKHSIAEMFLENASRWYESWGAEAKIYSLEKICGRVLNKSIRSDTSGKVNIDALTIIKAANLFSKEIQLESLLKKMLQVIIENVGAERGLLLLENKGEFYIEARAEKGLGNIRVLEHINLESAENISKEIIKKVINQKEMLIYGDAHAECSLFNDKYIKNKKPKSVMCVPLIYKNNMSAIIYLENNIISSGFTKERYEILKFLSSEMMISLENANLYKKLEEYNRTLEEKVKNRTYELEKANNELFEQKKKAEEARAVADEATRVKSEFLANMSHEIRTPMNGIMGLAYLLKKTELNIRQKEYLEKIEDSSKHLLDVINDILDFSKIEAGKVTIEKTDFSLSEILSQISNILMKVCEDKGLELIYYMEPGIPFMLNGDALRIQQVLINLVGNAVKFTHKGEIVIRVELAEKNDKSVVLRFSVKDTGIGLSKEQQGRLFHSFTQADGSITRRFGGTGLGLAISKSFVELMGGTIGVTSEPNVGSTFYFQLELGIAEEKKREQLRDGYNLHGMKTLIVDDNESSLEILSSYMKSFGCIVETANSGYKAISKIKESGEDSYKLLLIDWKMPGIDGLATVERIKGDKEIPNMPLIIMVSAFDMDEIKSCGDKLMVDGYLTKPVRQSSLFDSVVEAIGANLPAAAHKAQKETDIAGVIAGRVLIVEDNRVNQLVAKEILSNFGLIAEVASGGIEAAAMAESNSYDMILMDIQMPEIDGYEATKLIRDKGIKTPVIAMTANAMKGDREKSMEMGMVDYVSKPIDADKLYRVMKKWIPERQESKRIEKTEKPKEREYFGINMELSLERMMGNMGILEKVIKAFIKEFWNADEKLRGYIKEGKTEELAAYMHMLKGASGNISAEKLYNLSIKIERNILENQPVELQEYEDLLSEIAHVLKNREKFEGETTGGYTNIEELKNIEGIKEALIKLKKELEMGSFESEMFYYKIEEKLGKTRVRELDEVKKAILSIEYEKAFKILSELVDILYAPSCEGSEE